MKWEEAEKKTKKELFQVICAVKANNKNLSMKLSREKYMIHLLRRRIESIIKQLEYCLEHPTAIKTQGK